MENNIKKIHQVLSLMLHHMEEGYDRNQASMTIKDIVRDLGNVQLPFKSYKTLRLAVAGTLLAYLTVLFLAGWVAVHFVAKCW